MKAPFLRVLGPRLLVSRPNGRQYGHLGLEMVMSLAEARRQGMAVCFLKPRRPASDALFALESDEVTVLHPTILERLRLHGRLAVDDSRLAAGLQLDRAREWLRDEVGKELARQILSGDIPPNLRDRLKRVKSGLAGDPPPPPAGDGSPYFKRRLIHDPVRVRLTAQGGAIAARAAAAMGIERAARIVTVHAREAGYKRGMEVQEKHARLGKLVARDDSARNARIESYFDAIDYLVAQGFLVVRIGDSTMTPVVRRGVVDLAAAPGRHPLLELHCLLVSEFLVSGEAGPAGVSYLTNTPILNVNATDPISSYPVRPSGLYLLKRVFDRSTGRELTPDDLLGEPYMAHVRDSGRYRYRDNTPEEIVAAVAEMVDARRRGPQESAAQTQYRERATRAAQQLRDRLPYVRKWGADDGFLGDGRIVRGHIERYG